MKNKCYDYGCYYWVSGFRCKIKKRFIDCKKGKFHSFQLVKKKRKNK